MNSFSKEYHYRQCSFSPCPTPPSAGSLFACGERECIFSDVSDALWIHSQWSMDRRRRVPSCAQRSRGFRANSRKCTNLCTNKRTVPRPKSARAAPPHTKHDRQRHLTCKNVKSPLYILHRVGNGGPAGVWRIDIAAAQTEPVACTSATRRQFGSPQQTEITSSIRQFFHRRRKNVAPAKPYRVFHEINVCLRCEIGERARSAKVQVQGRIMVTHRGPLGCAWGLPQPLRGPKI